MEGLCCCLLPSFEFCTSFLLLNSGGEHDFSFPLCNKLGTDTKKLHVFINCEKYETFASS